MTDGKQVFLPKKGGEVLGRQKQQMTAPARGYLPFRSSMVSKYFATNLKKLLLYVLYIAYIYMYFIIRKTLKIYYFDSKKDGRATTL